jgi:peptide/nickel transport system permease protein
MAAYIIRRILQAVPVIVLIAVVSFGLMMAAPGGPAAQFNQNPRVSAIEVERYLARWCLERKPTPVGVLRTFGGWLGILNCEQRDETGQNATAEFFTAQGNLNILPGFLGGGNNGLLHGDFGLSMSTNRPVGTLISERVPATLVLMTVSFLLWASIAVLLGTIAAVKRYSIYDQTVTAFAYIFYSLPTFWLGLMLIYLFAITLGVLPSQGIVDTRAPGGWNTPQYWAGFWADPLKWGFDIARHLVLPVTTLVAVNIAADSRYVRSSMLDTLNQDYVRTARAKGLPRRTVIFRHAFRNALLPIITNWALAVAFLFSGAIVTETVFSWPGMGRLYIEAINTRDYFLVMGVLFIGSILVVLMNLVADVIYAWADPRIRY